MSFMQMGFSQTTGSFNKEIIVDGNTRQIEYAVPNDYNSNEPYGLLVALRGCGTGTGPAATYRDQLEFMNTDFKTIVVAPRGLSDFYNMMDDSDSTIISKSIQDAISTYNIDENHVFLTGFSCNGYVTAKYGTYSTIYPFAGIIPYNPGIGSTELENGDFKFDTDVPVCICIGSQDPNLDGNHAFADSISNHGGTVLINEMPGVGHTNSNASFQDEMTECMNWLNPQLPPLTTVEIQNEKELVKWHNTQGKSLLFELIEQINNVQMDIYSVNGQLIMSKNISTKYNAINLSSLSEGSVIISLKNSNRIIANQIFTIK